MQSTPSGLLKHLGFFLLFLSQTALSQVAIRGTVVNDLSNEPIPFAVVTFRGMMDSLTVVTNDAGSYSAEVKTPGTYNVEAYLIGFQKKVLYEVELVRDKPNLIDIRMTATSQELTEVTVQAPAFYRKEESPVSMRSIGASEIKRSPGGNRDISKVLQSLPGGSTVPSFRNDLIVHGGSPNENRFYLDGIEVPNINHFATQGASGGPVGMLNVDFIREVDFYTGAFPANKGNALSSVMDLRLNDGRTDKALRTFTVGASDIAASYDGPAGKHATLLAGVRRSYLQFLFAALKLPFLPTYNDAQFKYRIRPDAKNDITILGLAAYDIVHLNTSANETEEQQYLLANLPENTQWNYTTGVSWKHYNKNSYTTLAASRNQLSNTADKYRNNDRSSEDNKLLDYTSTETENKLRFEFTQQQGAWKFNTGMATELARYTNSTFTYISNVGKVEYASSLNLFKYGVFAQASRTFSKQGIVLSAGLRADGNTFSSDMQQPLQQLSPRLSFSWMLTDKLSFNANTGIYYQLPTYTTLGYRDSTGTLVNKSVKYIQCTHLVAGFEYLTTRDARINIEGFYKLYNHYPFDLNDSVSIANQGSDFGVIGDVPVDSRSKGRSMGLEVLVQQKLHNNFYGLLSYTYVVSEFTGLTNTYTSASWDYRHMISLTAGKIFKRNWEAGAKFRFNYGAPFTPYDATASALKSNWNINYQALPNYARLNAERTAPSHQLDIRIDKKYFFRKFNIDVYLDIQNIYNRQTTTQPYLTTVKDAGGNPVTDPDHPDSYLLKEIPNSSGSVLPTIGLVIEF